MTQSAAPKPKDLAPRWFFNCAVDLETYLACITDDPCQDAQGNVAYGDEQARDHLVCAFAPGFEPDLKTAVTLAASREMLALLRLCVHELPLESSLRQQAANVIALVDNTPAEPYEDEVKYGSVKPPY